MNPAGVGGTIDFMEKFFNTVGPNQPDIHYTRSPIERVN
jgi:hypothetical protein